MEKIERMAEVSRYIRVKILYSKRHVRRYIRNVKFIKMHSKDTIERENNVINIYCYIP